MNYSELKTLIDAYVNRNGVQAITGSILNGVLNEMVDQLGRGYQIMGVADPTDNPGLPDGPECWFAGNPGTYTNFGGITVIDGEIALLCYDTGWTKRVFFDGFANVEATVDSSVGTPAASVSYADGTLTFTFSNLKGDQGNPAEVGEVTASVDDATGTPDVIVTTSGPDTAKNIDFSFKNLKGETGDAAGFGTVVASVDNNVGIPSVAVVTSGPDTAKDINFAFKNLKGPQGAPGTPAGFGTVLATVDSFVGTPGVDILSSGPDSAKNFTFRFTNLKGDQGLQGEQGIQGERGQRGPTGVESAVVSVDNESGIPYASVSVNHGVLTISFHNLKGEKGDQGNTGSSIDYPYELVNNLTTNDAEKGLSAAMGVQLESEIVLREQEIDDIEIALSLTTSEVSTTNDDYVPTSYSGNDVEDPRQVLPAGKQLLGVTLLSTGASGSASSELRIYNNNRELVDTINLGTIGDTDTYVDLSAHKIIIIEGYHYSIYRIGYKWVSGLDEFVNPANGTVYSSSFFGFTFKYKEVNTKYDDALAEIGKAEDALRLEAQNIETTNDDYVPTSYANNEVEDPRQVLPVGAQLLGINFKSTGETNSAGYSQLRIYDEERTLVETIMLESIGDTDTYMDVSEHNIIIQDGYHYGVYRVGYAWVSGYNHFEDPRDGSTFSSSFFGFTFEYRYFVTRYDGELAANRQYVEGLENKLAVDLTGLSSEEKEMELVPNHYITNSGSVSANNSYSYTKPIALTKGQTILLYGSGYLSNVAMVSKVITEDSLYQPVVISRTNVYKYICVVPEDGDYAFSFHSTEYHRLYVINNSIVYLVQKVNEKSLDAGPMRLFCGIPSVGVIGDSMATGTGYDPYDGNAHEYPQYAWWKYLERESGMTYRRFASGGQTTRSFLTDSTYGLPATLTAGNECKLYVIGLEINDRSKLGDAYLGTINDIDMADPDNNEDTYYGNYARIIQKITAFNPKARFILFTNPRTESSFNDAIRDIAGLFSNCYLVDLYNKYHTLFETGGLFYKFQDPSGHYASLGYQGMSKVLSEAIDECIADNPSGFDTIQY